MCVNNASDNIAGCNDSIIICISPLTSLVMDQREKLRHRGVNAEYVGKQQKDWAIVKKVLNAGVELVFISPECILCNKTFRSMLHTPAYKSKLVALVIDEAHCVKTWHEIVHAL